MAGKEEKYALIFEGEDKVSPEMQKIIESLGDLDKSMRTSEKASEGLQSKLGGLGKDVKGIDIIKSGLSGIGSAAELVAGAVAVSATAIGAGIAAIGVAAIKAGIEVDEAAERMAAAVGAPESSAREFESIIEEIYGSGIPDTIQEAAAIAEKAWQRFGDAGAEEVTKVADASQKLAELYENDFNKVIGATSTLVKDFGITSDQAFDFIAKGFQEGLDGSGDFLDSVNEYSTQFKEGGATAGEFFSLLETGFQEGILGTDKAADAFKEFRLRVNDETEATAEALQALGIDSQKTFDDLRTGTKTTAGVFQEVVKAVQQIEDPVKAQTTIIGLFGTQFEDLGKEAFENIDLTKRSLEDLTGSFDKTSRAFETVANAWAKIWRKTLLEITNLDAFEEFTEKVKEYFVTIGKNFDDAIAQVDFSDLEKSVKELLDTFSGAFSDVFGDIDLTTVEGLRDFIQDIVSVLADMVSAGAKISAELIPIFQKIVEIFSDVLKGGNSISDAFVLIGRIGEALVLTIKAAGEASLLMLTSAGEAIASVAEIVLSLGAKIFPSMEGLKDSVSEFRKNLTKFKDELATSSVDSFSKALEAGGSAADAFSGKAQKAGAEVEKLPDKKNIEITGEPKIDKPGIEKKFSEIDAKVKPKVDTSEIDKSKKFVKDEYGNLRPVVDVAPKVDEQEKKKTEKELLKLEETKIEVEAKITLENIKAEADKFITLAEQTGETARKALEVFAEIEVKKAESELKRFESALESTTSIINTSTESIAGLFAAFNPDLDFYQIKLLEETIRQQIRLTEEQAALQKELIELQIERMKIQNKIMNDPSRAVLSVQIDPSIEPALDMVLRSMLTKTRIFGLEKGFDQLIEVPFS